MNQSAIRILLIEDNPGDFRLVKEMLSEVRNIQFDQAWADSLATGLKYLTEGSTESNKNEPNRNPDQSQSPFNLVLLDLDLPDSHGLDTLLRVIGQAPEVPIVVMTGLNDEQLGLRAVKQGAQDYLIKGQVDSNLLARTIRHAIERKRMQQETQHTMDKLRKALGGIVQAMALTVEKRDPYTAGHQQRVAHLARAIAKEMGLSTEVIDAIRIAGLIHDLGKISVPVEILSKPGAINGNEFGIIKSHPQIGYDILKEIEFPFSIAQIVLQHHERMDGSGYPLGLSGEAILQEARILGVADVVEAMASHRPYRPALGIDVALEEILRNKDTIYDPEVADACLKLFREKGFKFA